MVAARRRWGFGVWNNGGAVFGEFILREDWRKKDGGGWR